MSKTKRQRTKTKAEVFFTPNELAILGRYLGQTSSLPEEIQQIYVFQSIGDEGWNEATQGVRLELSRSCNLEVENAVARMCLQNVQQQLPQWGCYDGRRALLSRHIKPAHDLPPRLLLPRLLFAINWATSGPGYDWPEDFYVTEIPFFNVFVVTSSFDSPDTVGFIDVASGFFDADVAAKEGAKKLIVAQWSKYKREGDQARWQCVTGTGLISEEEAEAWADEVWPRAMEGQRA